MILTNNVSQNEKLRNFSFFGSFPYFNLQATKTQLFPIDQSDIFRVLKGIGLNLAGDVQCIFQFCPSWRSTENKIGKNITLKQRKFRKTDGWNVIGTGDFDGDGIDDVLLSDGTGLAGWDMDIGQRWGNFWFGNLAAGDKVEGIADFNNDGIDDILVRTAATETLYAWTVKAGAVSGYIAIA